MMASALMDGLVSKGITTYNCLSCSDVLEQARTKDAIILAVKPYAIPSVCKDIKKDANEEILIISIAAGVTLSQLESFLPSQRIIRVMPNTPCLVGEAACCFATGKLCHEKDVLLTKTIFGSVGLALQVEEKLLDAVTGLSGSGPAYVFQFIEALSDGGVRVGLPRSVATQLAAQTVKGAAEMVLLTNKHPGELKDAVTSPGGTTIAGVQALENGKFRSTAMAAVCAATRRSLQLSGNSSDEI